MESPFARAIDYRNQAEYLLQLARTKDPYWGDVLCMVAGALIAMANQALKGAAVLP